MKRFYALLLTLCLLTGFASAESADITKQLLEEQLEILRIENMEDEFPPEMKNVVWRKGGTTQELIDDQTWDVAEVSSLQVDLNALTDAGVIWRSDYLCPDASALNPMLEQIHQIQRIFWRMFSHLPVPHPLVVAALRRASSALPETKTSRNTMRYHFFICSNQADK